MLYIRDEDGAAEVSKFQTIFKASYNKLFGDPAVGDVLSSEAHNQGWVVLRLLRPVTRGGSGGSYEPPHEITRSGFLICIKLLIQIIT